MSILYYKIEKNQDIKIPAQIERAKKIKLDEPDGGDKRDRTADLPYAIQALSQLSYTPI